MCTEQKLVFLERFNPRRDPERALSRALGAALQHNDLYRSAVTDAQRREIRNHWKRLLRNLSDKYRGPVDLEAFLDDILFLKNSMNAAYGQFFRAEGDPSARLHGGFRISHAQKSLSVYLKHLWCLEMIVQPPACPVDRTILEAVRISPPNWTNINTMEEHRNHLATIQAHADEKHLSLAVWELLEF